MIEHRAGRYGNEDGTHSDYILFRFAPETLRLVDIGGAGVRARLADMAHYRYVKALARGEPEPVIVAFAHLAPDQPVDVRFPELSYTTEDGERLYSSNSFITYTLRTLFRRGWIRYDGSGWQACVPDGQAQWRVRAEAVLDFLVAHDLLYLRSERRGALDFGELPLDVDQDLVPVAPCDFVSAYARRHPEALVFNSAFFLLEHDDIFNRHSALCEAHSLWVAEGIIRRPALFHRGAIWQGANGHWDVGYLGPEDVAIHLPNGLVVVPEAVAPRRDGLTFTINPPQPGSVALYTRYYGVESEGYVLGRTPLAAGRLELTVVDRRIVGLKEGGELTLPHNGFVLSFAPGTLGEQVEARMRARLRESLLLGYSFAHPRLQTAVQALQAGPILLQDGRMQLDNQYLGAEEQFWASRTLPGGRWQIGVVPTSYKTDVDQTRAGRAGLGIDADGNLVLVMVAGVNEGMGVRGQDSFGATLVELADLLRTAGACAAVNLDGGGSTQAYYRTKQVLVPGDRRGVPGQIYERLVPSVGVVRPE